MYTICMLSALVATSSAPAASDQDPFQPEILVHAKCIRVTYPDHRRWQKAIFRIEFVYCGNAKLKGTTFEKGFILDQTALINVSDCMLAPAMREDEEGIWYLLPGKDDNTLQFVPVFNSGTDKNDGLSSGSAAFPVPARKIVGNQDIYGFGDGNHIHYPSALRWARVVEKVYKEKRSDRLKMLREYALSENPYVSAWAIRILARYKPNDLIPFLENLLKNSKLSVAGQVTIDEVLCNIDWKNWNGSKQRAALLQHWVNGEIIETLDALMIAVRIEGAFHLAAGDGTATLQLDWKTWLPLMEKWVTENHLTPSLENRLYYIYQRVRREPATDLIYSYASAILRTSKDVNRQRFAAKWLGYIPLTGKQKVIVKDFMIKTKNREILELLEEAIRNSALNP